MPRFVLLALSCCSLVFATACPPSGPVCGDAITEGTEDCDDGNLIDGDGCSSSCADEAPESFCGDGTVDSGEDCDDGNSNDEDGCSSLCATEFCGDGVLQAALGEACDNGDLNSDITADACRTTCLQAGCGDQVVDSGEVCDDGNVVAGDGCDDQCFDEGCGDGIVQPLLGEECDDGGANSDINPDACRTTCLNPSCGDLVTDANEDCDDGNGSTNDGCNACVAEVCGDGILHAPLGEGCDDGNQTSNDGCSAFCAVETCGDGLVQNDPNRPEECDDGNSVNQDGCSSSCRSEYCGDGVVQVLMGEQCDDSNAALGDGCDQNCIVEQCGNGVVQQGEQCDDGNSAPGDSCDANCVIEQCGNGTVQFGEQCDDGNFVPGDGCDASCVAEFCGDGVRQVGLGEECDAGPANSNSAVDACRLDCSDFGCGDGVVDSGETCDDSNGIGGDGCSAVCVTETCGDGTVNNNPPGQTNEECDDGNTTSGDGCDSTCGLETCPNGLLDPGETCDDGNAISGDGCSAGCQTESCGDGIVQSGPPRFEACDNGPANSNSTPNACRSSCALPSCGDTVTDAGETCDDGNAVAGDGCDSCVAEFCGDGAVNNNGTEQCDDGNAFSNDGCNASCITEFCGDGTLQNDPSRPELCDDGNFANGDGCTDACVTEVCGDGTINNSGLETCDDGNTNPGDGCDSSCQIEAGCGDGTLQGGEGCDDGNTDSFDGCSATCVVEFCGDGIANDFPNEDCDDGGNTDSDGCSSGCLYEFCGDGVVQANFNELCDDGNNFSGDGCSSACRNEFCGDGQVAPGVEECDDGNTVAGDGCDAACIMECVDDGFEDNDDETQATDLDAIGFPAALDATLCGVDVSPAYNLVTDWYQFTATAGEDVSIEIQDGLTTACADQNLLVQLYDATTFTLAAGSNSSPFQCPSITLQDLPADTYYVLVWADPAPGFQDYGLVVDKGSSTCGNSAIEVTEDCDDGNAVSGDGCSATCQVECVDDAYEDNDEFQAPYDATGLASGMPIVGSLCGDDVSPSLAGSFDFYAVSLAAGERLIATVNDGFTDTCLTQGMYLQFYATDAADPNNGIFIAGDASDGTDCPSVVVDATAPATGFVLVWSPGGAPDQDYTLTIDYLMPACGNGLLEGGEDCDDGNVRQGDGCSDICVVEGCGNGIVEPGAGEWCDDGNMLSMDGCDATCQLEMPPACADADGDGDPSDACGGGDCDDTNPLVSSMNAELAGDGLDNDCDGVDPYAICATAGPRAVGSTGTLTCADTTGSIDWDWYEVAVTAGECVDVHIDNDPVGADLLAFAQDANGITFYGLEGDYSELDDEWACSTPIAFGCPSQPLTAASTGNMLIAVGQWGGGCSDGAGYTLFVARNGVAVPGASVTLVQDDTPLP